MKTLASFCALLFLLGMTPFCSAGPYPSKPIKLIVGFPAGGPADYAARLIGTKLAEALGQPVIVDNRAGAGGTIGAEAAAKSPGDGYTLFWGSTGTLASAPSLYPNLGYDPVKSFAPISRVINGPFLVVVNASVPANSLRELIDLAKTQPGKLNYGSGGNGGPPHIAAEMFKVAAGVNLVHVPYKGMAPALPDLLAGRIDLIFDLPATWLPHIRTGKIKALAVAGPRRLLQLPNVPTTAEAGLPGYEISVWFGLVAPADTPIEIVRRLNVEVQKALAIKEVQDSFSNQGFEPAGSSPEEFAALIRRDGAKWANAVKASGAKID